MIIHFQFENCALDFEFLSTVQGIKRRKVKIMVDKHFYGCMDATIIMPKMPSAGNYGENFNESEQDRASQLKLHKQSVNSHSSRLKNSSELSLKPRK